jgi:hypothetical protein
MSETAKIYEAGEWVADDRDVARVKRIIRRAMINAERHHGFTLGPIRWYSLKPGSRRAGRVPAYIKGTSPRLIVGEAIVVGHISVVR